MNQLTEKLLDQCHIETYGVNGELLEFGFDAEKFAELIVNNCIDLLGSPESAMNNQSTGYGEYNTGWVNGRLLGIDHIRQHFGVEQ